MEVTPNRKWHRVFHGQPCAVGMTDTGQYKWTVRSHHGSQVWGNARDLREALAAAERAVDMGMDFAMSARRRAMAKAAQLRKGAPFAEYEDFEECEQDNADKEDPSAYCGEIKKRTEDKD